MGFVLEGPDGAGKSTLANRLHDLFGLEVNHFGPPTKPPIEEYLHWLLDKDAEGHNRVVDRFHLGESVYGPIFRGSDPLSMHDLTTIEWALMVRGYTMIYVTTSLKTMIDNIERRGDDMVNPDRMAKITQLYDVVIQVGCMESMAYDYQHQEGRVNWARARLLQKKAERYRAHCGGYPGTGSLAPMAILVGERPNSNLTDKARGVPFAAGTAGEWLIDAIWRAGWWQSVYVTNAEKVDKDRDMVAREIRFLWQEADQTGNPRAHVIALGKFAAGIMSKHQIPHAQVVHPSYHRRFNYHDGPDAYAHLLAHSGLRGVRNFQGSRALR